jgi:FKBP-type peptidyl-prolyl cis-trans isomerase FkpA
MEVDVTLRFPESSERRSDARAHTGAALKLALLAMLIAAAAALSACSLPTESADQTTPDASSTAATLPATEATLPADAPATSAPTPAPTKVTKLKIRDLKVGKGTKAKKGDLVTVNYTGWLMDGTQFDSSIGVKPFSFTLGAGNVIPGWDKGVVGMRVGGKRQLIIPASLAYGDAGAGGTIPPNATLKFNVTMLLVNNSK